MPTPNRNGDVDIATFPGRTVTIELSAAQLGYIRVLLYEDLQKWAETLAEQASEAHTAGGKIAGVDTRETFRRCVAPTLLDLIGWETDDMIEEDQWVNRQAREWLAGPELTAAEKREGEDR